MKRSLRPSSSAQDSETAKVELGWKWKLWSQCLPLMRNSSTSARSSASRADRGEITPIERDLLIDGAILLAMHIDDDLARDGRVGSDSGWPEGPLPKPAGRHERRVAVAAA